MRLPLTLFLAVVVVAVLPVKALPRGANGKDPGPGVRDSALQIEDVINQGDDLQTTDDVVEDTGGSGVETLDNPKEGVQSDREVCHYEEVEAEIKRNGEENQEGKQDSKEEFQPAESKAVVVESDSSEESSIEEETVTSSEARGDHDSQDEVPVDISKKSKGSILEHTRIPSKLKNNSTTNEKEDTTDSSLEKRDTVVLSECLPKDDNCEILVQAEPLAAFINKENETSDLEIAQSEINKIIFGEEEESVEDVETQEGSVFSDGETDDTHNEEVDTEEASTYYQTGESLVRKRAASVEESSEDREVVLTDEPRILSPVEFFGYFEDDESTPVTDDI